MKISIKVRGLVVNALRGKRRAALVGILVGNGLFLGDREDGKGWAVVLGGSLVVGGADEEGDNPA